jgi:hypothetical protein
MIVPVAVRSLAAVIGGTLVIAAWTSVVGTLIVPRRTSSRLTQWTDRIVDLAFIVAARTVARDRRERVLRAQGAAILIVQFAAWLGSTYIGFTLLLWPFLPGGITQAFAVAGSLMSSAGLAEPTNTVPPALLFLAAASGLIIIAPQIAYLPALYAAYSRRETEVTLLNERAGVPSWGPELLARTRLMLGSDAVTIEMLSDLYAQWERWAADVSDSHTAYLPLVRFRSSRRNTSWAIALLAVLDSAALFMAVSPESAPTVPARGCLRVGFRCFTRVAEAMGFPVDFDPDPRGPIGLSHEEFLDAVDYLRRVNFPIERDPAEAWTDFIGWRVNYEQAAYAVAKAIDAPPARWSGPRRRDVTAIPPHRLPS